MSYETGQYEYAQPSPELDDDVVTETATDATSTTDTVSAARSIPPRPQAPVFVSSPTIQPIDPSNPVYYSYETLAAQPAPAHADHPGPRRHGSGAAGYSRPMSTSGSRPR